MTVTPSIMEILGRSMDSRLAQVNTSCPGRVTEYNPLTRRASVQPLVPKSRRNEEGEREVEQLPIVNEVPIMFPGSGGARFRFPIHVGDIVLILFAQGSLDLWKVKGDESDTGDDRKHAISDAVAIPGLQHAASDADVMIEVTESEIHAGGTDALALRSELQEVVDLLNNHAHSGVSSGAQTSGPPVAIDPAAPVSLFPGPTGTTVLKGA